MLKLIMCVKRLPHLTREQFDVYWRDKHGPLVRAYQDVLGIKRYIQTMPLDNLAAQTAIQAGRGALAVDFDGCAELWWNSLEDHLASRKTVEGAYALQKLLEDEQKFVDLSQSQLWYGIERSIIPNHE